jgi:hypothetical protein
MLTVEQQRFDIFMNKFKNGAFRGQRLGQAFYNEFKLEKVANQEQFGDLYESDGQMAMTKIEQLFEFS